MLRSISLSLFSHRFLAISRWELYFIWLRTKNAFNRQNKKILKFLATRDKSCYLNLASGPRGLDDQHWVNIDGFADRNVHFLVDISRTLPFPNSTFDGVFCEHVLEHFSLEDGKRLAQEILRILRPNGVLRLVVPDAAHVVRTYTENPEKLVSYRCGNDHEMTPMEAVNCFFRQRYEHQFLYDWETLQKMLSNGGFKAVKISSYGHSQLCQSIVLDDKKYAWESLYVEAVKR
jgi:predicted SAM-dependent methyltransferase